MLLELIFNALLNNITDAHTTSPLLGLLSEPKIIAATFVFTTADKIITCLIKFTHRKPGTCLSGCVNGIKIIVIDTDIKVF